MISESMFTELYKKLKDNTLTREEYELFLELVNTNKHVDFVKKIITEGFEGYPIQPNAPRKISLIHYWKQIAAILAIVVGSYFIWHNGFNKPSSSEIAYSTTDLPSSEIILPDSSKVKLNAFTKIIWVKSSAHKRVVKLSGEAFFEVVHTKDHRPFEVVTSNAIIKVLGTSFNVNTRDEKDKVFLQEGKIELLPVVSASDNGKGQIILAPGQSAIVSKKGEVHTNTQQKKIKDESLWKDGLLQFSDEPLSEVLRRIGEVYKKRIDIHDKEILNKKMELTLPLNNWELTHVALQLIVGDSKLEIIDLK